MRKQGAPPKRSFAPGPLFVVLPAPAASQGVGLSVGKRGSHVGKRASHRCAASKQEKCEICSGTGFVPCDRCGGSGFAQKQYIGEPDRRCPVCEGEGDLPCSCQYL
eukprot:tig00020554_g10854.t1